jgi:hypothetical protein
MSKIDTISMIKELAKNPKLRFTGVLRGDTVEVFVNQNKGIGLSDRSTFVLSGDALQAKWEQVQDKYSFMEAINSGKRIKHESWQEFKLIEEALYNILDYPITKTLNIINGNWHIEA